MVNLPNAPYVLKQQAGQAGDAGWLRPINTVLFVEDPDEYCSVARDCLVLLNRLRRAGANPDEREELLGTSEVMQGAEGGTILDRFLYTTVQAVGCVYDLGRPNQRLFGLFYQAFVHAIVRCLGFDTSSLNIQVPKGYWDLTAQPQPEPRTSIESVEVDMVLGPLGQDVRTTQYSVWPEDSFATIKTSTKDRISQVFLDAVSIQQLSVWRIARYMLFIHNDVQRTGSTGVSWTFLPTNFTGGSKTFPLSGIYFSDMPENVISAKSAGAEWARLCRYLSQFVCRDAWL